MNTSLHRSLLSRILCISCASFVLVGCSYFDTAEGPVVGSQPETVVVNEYPDRPVDLSAVVYEHTGGSVQLFDLDSAAPMAAPPMTQSAVVETAPMEVAPAPAVPVGQVYAAVPTPIVSADPSVEIFPFEDFTPLPVSAQMAEPYTPPARSEDYVALGAPDGDKVIVYFGHDSATLSQQGLTKVAGVAEAFNAASSQGITVEGHASITANYNTAAQRRIVNLKVSMDRAFSVARELIARGVPGDFIRVMAWGDARPAGNLDGKTPEDAARRVEISQ